jgi:hypothetical protein
MGAGAAGMGRGGDLERGGGSERRSVVSAGGKGMRRGRRVECTDEPPA